MAGLKPGPPKAVELELERERELELDTSIVMK